MIFAESDAAGKQDETVVAMDENEERHSGSVVSSVEAEEEKQSEMPAG